MRHIDYEDLLPPQVVAKSERVRVFGLEATDSLLKAYLSLLGSAALVITGLQNLLQ